MNENVDSTAEDRWSREIADKLGRNERVAMTVRQLLLDFGARRRGRSIVEEIRETLEQSGLTTIPDFATTGFDDEIQIRRSEAPTRSEQVTDSRSATGGSTDTASTSACDISDTSLLVGALPTARAGVVAAEQDERLSSALTKMMIKDYSQLPVMRGERDVKGIISWKSVGQRRVCGHEDELVRDCMENRYKIVDVSDSVFSVLSEIIQAEFVLVRDQNRVISGIITTTDVAGAFRSQFEPFVLLGEIENQLRRIIHGHFDLALLQAVRDPKDNTRPVNSASDLSLGEYKRLLENVNNWSKLTYDVERVHFIEELEQVRETRNEVMHFSPDPVPPEGLDQLRHFARFLGRLR